MRINSTQKSNIIVDNSIIENAQTAILAESGAIIRVSISTFRNNRFDVVFEPYHSLTLKIHEFFTI